jgi:Bacterial membrane protein YfhO
VNSRKAVALLVALIAIAYADILLLGRGFYLSDVTSYHYPMKKTVRDIVARGEMPYWNPLASGGQPLAANPAYELWYPPQWLIFLPSFHFGFQLHVIVHFTIAALGMFLLLRSLDASVAAALFGALAFAFSGPVLSLSTKLPLLFAYAWMPLALYFTRRLISEWSFTNLSGAALTLGMQLLIGEPTMVLQTWMLIAAYLAYRWRSARGDVPRVALAGVLAALVAAAQLIPALDFARDTVRVKPMFWLVANWSMPLFRPVEMLFPSLFTRIPGEGGHARVMTMYAYRTEPYINEIYLGIFVAVLALAAVLTRKRGALAFSTLFIGAVILAAGEHTPLLQLFYDLHIGRSLRYPEKFVLTAAFVTIVWAALQFDRLRGDAKLTRMAAILAIVIGVISLFAGLAANVSPLETRTYFAMQFARAALVAAFLGPWRTRLRPHVWTSLVIALTTADLIVSMRRITDRMPREYFTAPPLAASLPENQRVHHELASDLWLGKPQAVALFSGHTMQSYWQRFRETLSPNLPMMFGRPMILEDDIDRTSLQPTEELRELLRRYKRDGDGARELQLLRMSNAQQRIRAGGAEPLDGYPRYAFADAMQRGRFEQALLVPAKIMAVADVEPFPLSRGTVTSIRETNNTIRLTTKNAGRGLLLITVTAHRYWRATIDGREAALIPANVAYQALDVPAGEHTIELRYRNPLVIPSAIVSLLTAIVLGALYALQSMRRYAKGSAAEA